LNRLARSYAGLGKTKFLGGLSPSELAEYNRKSECIRELAGEIHMGAIFEKSSGAAQIEQQRQWNKDPETDTPQAEAHQPYRSREKDSTDSSTDLESAEGANKSA
jgi:hypothetical protein